MADHPRILPFATQSEITADDLIALWTGEGALSLEEASRRVREAVMVAVHGGRPVGVCTAYLRHNEQLRLPFWYFRAFVAAAHRTSDIAIRLTAAARDHLSARHEQGVDRRAAGVLMEVENDGLKRRFPEGYWWRVDFTFVGTNARGDHVRVHYFPGVAVQGST
jgi:hypothetical protein